MTRSPRRLAALAALLACAAVGLTACGPERIDLAAKNQDYRGAQLFAERCSGCHTLNVAGAQGSASDVRTREYKDGPSFNTRRETVEDVLYAIRNGGFSSGPMPQNIVVGKEAEQVADFVAKYSGNEAKRSPNPGNASPAGGSQGDTSE